MGTKKYKVIFKPVEPYFFGNEKSFIFSGQEVKSAYSSSYFAKSEETPSQSTILGALRYIFLAHKKTNFGYNGAQKNENASVVGQESFDIDSKDEQTFGIIEKIFPVFIQGKDENGNLITLVPTPMDHNIKEQETKIVTTAQNQERKQIFYTPFCKYITVKTTLDRKKLYADDFDVKEGLERSYIDVQNRVIYSKNDLFKTDLRIGINRSSSKDGFFKKEYKILKDNFAFAVYAELDIDKYKDVLGEKAIDISKPQCVFLGQGKSAFYVTFEEEENSLKETVKGMLENYRRTEHQFIYCLSDSFITSFDDNVLFCAIDTKEYRAYKTMDKGRVKKNGVLHRLLKAGSIIITDEADEWIKNNSNQKAEKIGFNNFIKIGG